MIYIIGSGLFGSVMAELITSRFNLPVSVIDKRSHTGGNCYSSDDPDTGINCHRYGAHIFHTSDKEVYEYVTRFTELNSYRHQVMTRTGGKVYQMPINLKTVNQFFNVSLTPSECESFLREKIAAAYNPAPKNLEEQAITLIGKELYEAFIRGYTAKQWQRDPKDLPAYIIKRLPFRTSYNSDYFTDRYQGIPVGGYQSLFEGLLSSPLIRVSLNTEYKDVVSEIKPEELVIYTGCPDELFDYRYGALEWRSLDFKWEVKETRDYQGTAVMNEADESVPYTRTHEFRHFHPEAEGAYSQDKTVICREYSKEYKAGDTPYYPIDTPRNRELYARYAELARTQPNLILGGRLGMYRYMDMDKTIRAAMDTFEALKERLKSL